MSPKQKNNILVTTSTFPRWENDNTPGFVLDFCRSISDSFDNLYVIAPHHKGAPTKEIIDNKVRVRRYRYFLPEAHQTIAYDGGAHTKIKIGPIYAIKLMMFLASQLIHSLYFVLFKKVRIINAHWLIPQGFIAIIVKLIAFKKVRVVVTVHGSDVLKFNGRHINKVKSLVLKYADEVVVNSSVTLEKCQELYSREYSLIPMGINIKEYKDAASSKDIVKKYTLNSFTVLFVGRFSEEKGIIYLCKALKKLKASGAEFEAILIGDGPKKEEIVKFIDNSGLTDSVHITGWVKHDNLPKYYKVADVLVGPSLLEALGIVFLEALASGVPIIATKVGGIRDVLIDEFNGLSVKTGSSEDIFEKLDRLTKDGKLLNEFKSNATKSVSEEYSWDTIAVKYALILKG